MKHRRPRAHPAGPYDETKDVVLAESRVPVDERNDVVVSLRSYAGGKARVQVARVWRSPEGPRVRRLPRLDPKLAAKVADAMAVVCRAAPEAPLARPGAVPPEEMALDDIAPESDPSP